MLECTGFAYTNGKLTKKVVCANKKEEEKGAIYIN